MTYQRHLHWTSCFLIFTGFFSIMITHSYATVCLGGLIFTGLYWLYGDRITERLRAPVFLYNITALIALIYLAYDGLFGKLDLIGNSIMFVVLLQIIKLLAPKSSRDWLQIYALSFSHIVASTALSTDVTFVGPFLVFLFLSTWTFTLFTIKKQMEDSVPASERAARMSRLLGSTQLVGKGFFWGTGVLTCIIIGVGLVIFFMFPRLSFKNFIKRSAAKETITGFSSEIELGTIGTIKTNEGIVMRAEVPEDLINEVDVEELYWRGTASDHFDGRRWKQNMPDTQRVNIDLDSPFIDLVKTRSSKGKILHYTLFMESLTTPMLFTLDGTYRITWDKPMVERFLRNSFIIERNKHYNALNFVSNDRFATDLTFKGEAMISGLKSELGNPSPDESKPQTPLFLDNYLQIPQLAPKVLDVLEKMNPDRSSNRAIARDLLRYLELNYRYTLAVEDKGATDPLTHFLVSRKEGHCEYFATALIVALRYYQVPARMVMGFRGGEINYYGHYIVVRQKDAHSWVEAYFPDRGWLRLDPSPADSVFARQGTDWLQPFYQLMDYARLRWTKYILDYDLRTQASALEKLGRKLSSLFPAKRGEKQLEADELAATSQSPKALPWKNILTFLFLVILGIAGATLWRRRKLFGTHGLYKDVLNTLKPLGITRSLFETPRELRLRIQAKYPHLSALDRLTQMYYEHRYANAPLQTKEWQETLLTLQKQVQMPRTSSKT